MNTPADQSFVSNDNSFNYYPNAMITLCNLAYDDFDQIANQVDGTSWLGQTVVWGPQQIVKEDASESLAYIAYRASKNEYTVVIRGTELDSWDAWVTEDFDTHKTEPLTNLIPNAPAGARLSQGTYNGIHDLNDLTDNGQTIVQFLQQANPPYLYVTGHSLGGTLTPVMYAYLLSVLSASNRTQPMALWSFAGLTPGNGDFNTYLDSLKNPAFPWRLYNTLDIAPNCWGNQAAIETIYSPTIPYGEPEKLVIDLLFDRAAGNGYAQPPDGGFPLPGTIQAESGWRWADEAAYQHHSTTYEGLVLQAYPWPT